MKTWTLRLTASWMAAFGLCAARLPAQEVVPAAQQIMVVPATAYEPARPQPLRPASRPAAPITAAGFQYPGAEPMPAPVVDFNPPPPPPGQWCWVRGEYLAWWIQQAPVRVPLITTGPAGTIGALNEPGTSVLFGQGSNQSVNFGAFSGLRGIMGGWIGEERNFSWEASIFGLEPRSYTFTAISPGGAAPVVSIPFFSTQAFSRVDPAGESSLNSGGAPTVARAHFTSQLWGAEANELIYLVGTERCYFLGVIGARFLDLNENLTLTYTNFDTTNSGTFVVTDGFNTRNSFYGGQVGFRGGIDLDRFNLEASTVVGIGVNHQALNIVGAVDVAHGAFGFASGTTPGGLFAQPSNSSPLRRNIFAVVPELNVKAGFALTPRVRAFLAYNALYWSKVARPGNQFDRDINVTQSAFFVPPGTVSGIAYPAPQYRTSGFWTQGVQIGLEYRF